MRNRFFLVSFDFAPSVVILAPSKYALFSVCDCVAEKTSLRITRPKDLQMCLLQ